jgi:hypothetical protein
MTCDRCPCPDVCLANAKWCAKAESPAATPLELKAICGASRLSRDGGLHAYPPAKTQATNLFRAVRAFLRSGFKIATRKERQARLAVCLGCDLYDQVRKRCRKCGCMNSAKVWIAADKCPLNKWPDLPI